MKRIYALSLAVLCIVPAAAIELSLEENRAERGSVGYVDMQRLFVNSPDAQRAKAGFEELVRQAEERVNLSKAELLKLRQEIDARRAERDALVASSATTTMAPLPFPPTTSVVATSTPVPQTALSTAAVLANILSKGISLPGMSTADAPAIAPPIASTTAVSVSTQSSPTPMTPPVLSTSPAPTIASTSTPNPIPIPAGPSYAQRLLELDGKIISLEADIKRKEADLARERDEADHGLLDVESRKTDQVLARLYRAITEVSRREGVSVVVDKTTILYGHPAVDITGKVLQYLKEAPQQ